MNVFCIYLFYFFLILPLTTTNLFYYLRLCYISLFIQLFSYFSYGCLSFLFENNIKKCFLINKNKIFTCLCILQVAGLDLNGGKANNSSPITTTKNSTSSSSGGVYVPPHLRGDSSASLKTSSSTDVSQSRGGDDTSRGSKYDRDQQRGGDYRRGGGGRNFNSRGGDRQSGDFSNFGGRGGGQRGGGGGGRYDDYNGKGKNLYKIFFLFRYRFSLFL